MDDVPDQAGPSVIADEASSGSKAGTAAIGLACLRWTKAAAAQLRIAKRFIRILHKMAILYGEVNIPVACGARVIACDVESSCLNDEEAQLVHCITGIHIDLATSIVQAKSTEA